MTQAIGLNPTKFLSVAPPVTTPPKISQTKYNLVLRNLNCFCYMVRYLEPKEVARCERVAKSWKVDRIWQAQCANHGVTIAPTSGRFKDLFTEIPEMAFGPREWRKHFGKIGPVPPLPANIKSQIAKLGKTHTLTLVPKTVNGQALSLNTFVPLAMKSGMKLNIASDALAKYINEAVGKSIWVWMEKNLKPKSRRKTHAQAEQDYPEQLGKALYYTVSIVAHYARSKICLLSQTPRWTYTRTCDSGEDEDGERYIVVVGSGVGFVHVAHSSSADDSIGVAGLVQAHSV